MQISRSKALVLLLLAACGGDATGSNPPPAPGPILIRGGDMGAQFENFSITRDGEPLTDAIVSVNGTTIPTSTTGPLQLPAALGAPAGRRPGPSGSKPAVTWSRPGPR